MTNTSVRRLEIFTSAAISVVVLVALGWRIFHAGPLWRDESAVVQLARMPDATAIFTEFTHEAFPPPFPLLIRSWTMLFGPTDASLRAYGFVVSIGFIAALWIVF